MNATEHVRAQLSAYLDGALRETERLAVEGHLASCADCRARLGELRATATLIRSLPDPLPSRRLVPRLAAPPVWFAPLRTLATLASGVSVFLFLVTALLSNIGGLASSSATTAAAPAVAPQASAGPSAARGAAPAPSGAPSSLSNADTAKQAASATPQGAAFSVTQMPVTAAAPETAAQRSDRVVPSPFTSPWLWLGLAIVTGIVAIALQRRLRKA